MRRGSRFRSRHKPDLVKWAVLLTPAVALVVVVVLLTWRGCARGGRSDEPWGGMSKEEWIKQRKAREEAEAKKETEAKKEAEAKKKSKAAQKANQAEAQSSRTAQGREVDEAKTEKAPELPPIPQEYTQWKDFDYYVARLTGNPRLVLAIEHRAQRGAGSEAEARFFQNLLAPHLVTELKRFSQRGSASASPKGDVHAVIGALVEALGRNGTPAARQVLLELLAGTLRTEDDQAAVEAVLKVLVDHPSEQNDAILLTAITEPEKLRAPGESRILPEGLQRQALGEVQRGGSGQIRLRLAERFLDPASPPALRKALSPLMEQKHPENIEAHAALYRSGRIEPKMKGPIERHLAECSSLAMQYFLGIAEEQALEAVPPDWPYRVARTLWSADWFPSLADALDAIDALEQGPNVILLASTIPTNQARSRLLRVWSRYREANPAPLESAGWRKTILSEPATLALLKKAHASEASVSRRRPSTRKTSDNVGEVTTGPEKNWLDAEAALVREMCRRFFAAALARRRSARDSGGNSRDAVSDTPPLIPLHTGARSVATYHLSLPGAHSQKLGEAVMDAMEIYYVRIEEKARPTSRLAHYERVLSNSQVHRLPDGAWIHSLVPWDKSGRTRCVDVLLTKANPKSKQLPGEEQELTVEVLMVAIPALEPKEKTERRLPAETELNAVPQDRMEQTVGALWCLRRPDRLGMAAKPTR